MAELRRAVRALVVFLLRMASQVHRQLAFGPKPLVAVIASELQALGVNGHVALEASGRVIVFVAIRALVDRSLSALTSLMIGERHFCVEVAT